jgi:hypothetical protein
VKGQKNEILTGQESRHLSRHDVFYFLPTAHFLKTILLPAHIAAHCQAAQADTQTKACQRAAILPTQKVYLYLYI